MNGMTPRGGGGSLFFDAWEHAGGYAAALAGRGLAPHIARITLVPDMADDVWAARAAAALAPFLHAPAGRRPTAVICYNDWGACGVLRAAAAAGLRVPHDLSVVGLNNLPMCMAVQPALTSIAFPGEALGGRAADLVMAPIAAADSALLPSLPPPTWMDRASVAHAPPCH